MDLLTCPTRLHLSLPSQSTARYIRVCTTAYRARIRSEYKYKISHHVDHVTKPHGRTCSSLLHEQQVKMAGCGGIVWLSAVIVWIFFFFLP